MFKKILKWVGITILVLALIYFLGPKPARPVLSPDLPLVSSNLVQLEKDIQASEATFSLKPDNAAESFGLIQP